MRAIIAIFFIFSSAVLAAENREPPRVFGEPSKDSIRISAIGRDFTEPGYYYLTSRSLAVFVREKIKIEWSTDSDVVRVNRKEETEEFTFTIKFGDIRAGKDFTLKDGDVVLIIPPCI